MEQVQDRARAPRLGVPGSEDHPRDPRLHNSAGAHGTGLQRHIEGAVLQPPVPCLSAGLPDRRDLRMGQRTLVRHPPVVAPGDDLPFPHDHTADRHLADRLCFLRLLYRCLHVFSVQQFLLYRHLPTSQKTFYGILYCKLFHTHILMICLYIVTVRNLFVQCPIQLRCGTGSRLREASRLTQHPEHSRRFRSGGILAR